MISTKVVKNASETGVLYGYHMFVNEVASLCYV